MNLTNFLSFDKEGKVNILGFSFYSDDLLIITLLFFLYSQKVNDKFIYIALILLLIN